MPPPPAATSAVDRLGPTPIYLQLSDFLRQRILREELRSGMRIPSERELAQQWGISRMTARAAVAQLIEEGYLRRVSGKGTFVERPRLLQSLQTLTSFTEDMRARGKVPLARVLAQDIVDAPPYVAARLKLHTGASVVKLARLRLADGEPMSLETAYLPAVRFGFLRDMDMTTASLYEVLAARGVQLAWAEQTVESRRARREEASWLGIPRQAPVLRTERTTFDREGQAVEHVQSVYRADRYTFNVVLFRR
jgi:GntR family transcriptional regulator